MTELLDVLKTLDPNNDSMWTEDGLPALDALKALNGGKKVTRQEVNDVALGLTRTTVTDYIAPPTQVKAVEPEVTTPVVLTQNEIKSQLDAISLSIEEASAKADTTESELAALHRKANELAGKLVQPSENEIFADNISLYVQSTAKERMERAEKLAKLEAAGISVDDLKELFPQLGMR